MDTKWLVNLKKFMSKWPRVKYIPRRILNFFLFRHISLNDHVAMIGRGALYVCKDDNRGLYVLYTSGVTQPCITKFWSLANNFIRPDFVLDIGANYGEIALSTKYSNHTSIHLIEANPYVSAYLKKSISTRKDANQFILHTCAASDQCGSLHFTIDRKWSGTSSAVGQIQDLQNQYKGVGAENFECVIVKAVPIDDILKGSLTSGNSLLFKMDVEGWEVNVLRGMNRTLSKSKNFIGIVEMDKNYLKKAGCSVEQLISFLGNYGELFYLNNFGLAPVQNVSTVPAHADLAVVSRNLVLEGLPKAIEL